MGLFLCGVKVSGESFFVFEVLKKFGVNFHQLTPSCFTKLSVFVWASKSQGVNVDLNVFLCLHQMHYQARKVTIEGATAVC